MCLILPFDLRLVAKWELWKVPYSHWCDQKLLFPVNMWRPPFFSRISLKKSSANTFWTTSFAMVCASCMIPLWNRTIIILLVWEHLGTLCFPGSRFSIAECDLMGSISSLSLWIHWNHLPYFKTVTKLHTQDPANDLLSKRLSWGKRGAVNRWFNCLNNVIALPLGRDVERGCLILSTAFLYAKNGAMFLAVA